MFSLEFDMIHSSVDLILRARVIWYETTKERGVYCYTVKAVVMFPLTGHTYNKTDPR